MFDNVSSEYLPDRMPDSIYPGPDVDYAHNTDRFNAAYEILERGIEENGWEGNTAIVSKTTAETLTYAEVREEVERFATVLLDLGVEPGDRVLWRLGDRPPAAIAQLAAWKIGAINVPCPLAESAREIEFFLNDTEATVVVASDANFDELERALDNTPSVEEVVVVGRDDGECRSYEELVDGTERHTKHAPTKPTDAASILYTGGTTGKPKGCLHSHAAEVVCADNDGAQGFDLGPEDVILTHGPVGHAFGNLIKITLPFRFGATSLYLDRPSPADILRTVEEENVTLLWLIQTMAKMILDECDVTSYDTSSLRIALINEGTQEVYDRWEELTSVQPGNMFGMTPLRGHPISSHRNGEKTAPGTALGEPYNGYEVKVVDLDDPTEEKEQNEPGKLAVRGPTSITYWCNIHPEVSDRMASDTHADWSLLDDVFTRDGDGYLHFETRLDDLINSAGRLISPRDVENVLLEHDGIRDAAVVGVPDDFRGEIVKAYVVPAGDISDERGVKRGVKRYAKNAMAPYKYPREIEFVDRIPRDELGKLQREELRRSE